MFRGLTVSECVGLKLYWLMGVQSGARLKTFRQAFRTLYFLEGSRG